MFQTTKLEPSLDVCDTLEAQRLSAFQGYANLVTSNIQRLVEFAKRVPGELVGKYLGASQTLSHLIYSGLSSLPRGYQVGQDFLKVISIGRTESENVKK